MSRLLGVYRAGTTALGPLIALYLARRMAHGKEDRDRFAERQGYASHPRPAGPLVWVHAASIGEAMSMLALIDRLLVERPNLSVLVTTGTVTSARLLATRLPAERAWHQYVPVDRVAYVRRFLAHWRPDLALWVESELWPSLISEACRNGVPLLLLNGRMSAKSFRGWQRLPGLITPLLASFDLCLAQDAAQAQRLARLGAAPAETVGNLKAAAAALPADEGDLARMAAAFAGRTIWLAASTHAGEEDAAAFVHGALRPRHPQLLTIIAPRHPARGADVAASLREKGFRVARHSRGDKVETATDIYLVDTLGELGIFYRLAGIAFVGGSLARKGGHNPIEAALLDCAILHGPDMSNTAGSAASLAAADASIMVRDQQELAREVARLIDNPVERARRAAAAAGIAADNRAVLDAVMQRIAPWLDRLSPDEAGA